MAIKPLMIALAVLFGLLLVTGYLLKGQYERNGELSSEVSNLQSALLTSERNNADLRAEIRRLDEIISRNVQDKLKIRQQLVESNAALNALQERADVREWGNQRHPDDIAMLLRESAGRDADGQTVPADESVKPLSGS